VRWLCFLLLLFSATANAEEWPTADKALLGAAVGLLVVDWGQTRHITREPNRFYEKNPLLGSHPSLGEVDRYFALAILGTAGVAYVLPHQYRQWFLAGVITLELATVASNHRLGLRVSF
jgi:hypothetical protein